MNHVTILIANNSGAGYHPNLLEDQDGSLMRNYATATKKPTSVSLAEPLLAEAKALGINVSQAAEEGLVAAVLRQRREQWLAENQDAFKSANEEFERRGLLLADLHLF